MKLKIIYLMQGEYIKRVRLSHFRLSHFLGFIPFQVIVRDSHPEDDPQCVKNYTEYDERFDCAFAHHIWFTTSFGRSFVVGKKAFGIRHTMRSFNAQSGHMVVGCVLFVCGQKT